MKAKKRKKYKKKKQHAVIVKTSRTQPYKWRFDKIDRFMSFLNKRYPNWRYLDLYNNRTKAFIERIVNPNYQARRYRCLVKLDAQDIRHWHTDDLLDFMAWLDVAYPNWRWFNVYNSQTGQQLGNYTQQKRPIHSHI